MILWAGQPYVRNFFMVSSSDHITPKTGASPSISISKGGNSFGGVHESAVEIGNGWYQIQLISVDTSGPNGEFDFHITATGADPVDFRDQINLQVFNTLNILSGGVGLSSSIKLGQAVPIEFMMTLNGVPVTGQTVTAKRSLNGGAFATCVNPVTEMSNGIYNTMLSPADTNASTVALLFTSSGADPQNISLITVP